MLEDDQNEPNPPGLADPLATAFLAEARLLPAGSFAYLMGWSEKTERAKRSRGETPPAIRVGRRAFYRHADVIDWLAARGAGGDGDDGNDVVAAAVSSTLLR